MDFDFITAGISTEPLAEDESPGFWAPLCVLSQPSSSRVCIALPSLQLSIVLGVDECLELVKALMWSTEAAAETGDPPPAEPTPDAESD